MLLLCTIHGSMESTRMPMGFCMGLEGRNIMYNTLEDYIQRRYYELNLRLRKYLGYKTSYEVSFSKVLHLA